MPLTRRAAVALLLAVGAVAAPHVIHAQPRSKVPRVGVIRERSTPDHLLAAFQQGLRDLGSVEGESMLSAKQLDLLETAAPETSRVGVLDNPNNRAHASALENAREAARALALDLQALELRSRNELPGAFAALTAWRAGGVLALGDPVVGNELTRLAQLATASRLPAIDSRREFVEAGGLLSYGPRFTENYRRAAS